MNRLPLERQAAIVRALTDGASIRATVRMVGVSKMTVLRLLAEVGEFCAIYQYHKLRNLACQRVQGDEIWSYISAKQRNATREGEGDVWTFTAICADTKLVLAWLVGSRSIENVHGFIRDMAGRLINRVQLTTDGNYAYFRAIKGAFGEEGVDYCQLVKHYVSTRDYAGPARYSPGLCTGVERHTMLGNPDPKHVSTSFVERQNLHMRMNMRRFTRLTNAFSRKVENHAYAVALHFMVYNFCRPHGTLTKKAKGVHTSLAMAAGVADHVWTIEELVGLLDPAKLLQ